MILGKLQIPKVVQENLTDIIKLYVRYGPDYNLISKEFQLIVEQKISIKFISKFCFQLNKKTYAQIVDYLKKHKEEKGQKQYNYDNLWPQTIDDPQLRTEIENIPTKILRLLNKDLSEAYNLLMESFSDSTLQKLFKYNRIRDLYQFMTQIILGKKEKPRRQRKDKKDSFKQIINKKATPKSSKNNLETQQSEVTSSTQWTLNEQRYLCFLYLSKSLLKCCQKMKQKFGQNEKWNTTKKIFKKAEQIFERSLKKAFRSTNLKSLKQTLSLLQTTKQNLIGQIIKKKSNQIQKLVLKLYKTNDSKKKSKNLDEINKEMLIILEKPELLKKVQEESEYNLKCEQKIKEQVSTVKKTESQNQSEQSQSSLQIQQEEQNQIKVQVLQQGKTDSQQKQVKKQELPEPIISL